MQIDTEHHAVAIERWLDAAGDELSTPDLISLFERALATLWERANRTLGEITLAAIVDRVLHVASEQYPFVSISKGEGEPIRFDARPLGAVQHDKRLREVICFVLTELVAVLGSLTGEILTPGLLAALANVEPRPRATVAADDAEGAKR
jgi:hypothetical protein